MRRITGILSVAITAAVFATQLSIHAGHEVNRTLGNPSADEARAIRSVAPGHVQVFEPTAADRDEEDVREFKIPLPAGWLSSPGGLGAARLLVFIDGHPRRRYVGGPDEAPETPYAYSRARQARFLLVRCDPSDPCRDVILVRSGPVLETSLAAMRIAQRTLSLLLLLVGLGSSIALVVAAGRGSPARALAALLVLAAWLALDVDSTPWALPVLVLEILVLSAPLTSPMARRLAHHGADLWQAAASGRSDTGARLARAGCLAASAAAVALPYILTGRSWYPGDSDDSFLYLRAASRLLASGSLLEGVLDPSAWGYSLYPLALAAASRAAGVHPMTAYRWVGYVGAALLPGAAGLFAYFVTGRLRPALLACWVGGLWAGLAGYVWLVSDALPSLAHGQPPPLIWDDYYEPRFLGEYAGPHSDVTAYLCRVPFYPRDAGLVLFWPALGLIYAGLARPGAERIVFALLTLASAAVYPYYGIAGVIVLATVSALEARRLPVEDRTKGLALRVALVGFAALGVAVIADLLIRHHKSPAGLLAYLVELWRAPAGASPWFPSLEFRWRRILSGHFFILAVMAAALGLGGARRLRAWPGWPLFLTSLGLATVIGELIVWSELVRRVLDPYGWIVPWRCLVEPVLLLGAALALDVIIERLRGRRLAIALLLLIPCFSALHWTINADLFLRRAAGFSYGRGRNQSLYEEFARYGSDLLGRVALRGPLVVPAGTAPFMEAAFGMRAVVPAGRNLDLLAAGQRSTLLAMAARGEIGDLVVRNGDPALGSVAASGAVPLASFGPYVVLRIPRVAPAASSPPQ